MIEKRGLSCLRRLFIKLWRSVNECGGLIYFEVVQSLGDFKLLHWLAAKRAQQRADGEGWWARRRQVLLGKLLSRHYCVAEERPGREECVGKNGILILPCTGVPEGGFGYKGR